MKNVELGIIWKKSFRRIVNDYFKIYLNEWIIHKFFLFNWSIPNLKKPIFERKWKIILLLYIIYIIIYYIIIIFLFYHFYFNSLGIKRSEKYCIKNLNSFNQLCGTIWYLLDNVLWWNCCCTLSFSKNSANQK